MDKRLRRTNLVAEHKQHIKQAGRTGSTGDLEVVFESALTLEERAKKEAIENVAAEGPPGRLPPSCSRREIVTTTTDPGLLLPEGWIAQRLDDGRVIITAHASGGRHRQVTVDETIRGYARGEVHVDAEAHTVINGQRRWRARLYAAAIADLRLSGN